MESLTILIGVFSFAAVAYIMYRAKKSKWGSPGTGSGSPVKRPPTDLK